MNTQGTEYGTYLTGKKGYQAVVSNPLTKEKTYLGYHKTKDEAQAVLNEWNFNFFSEHSWILPRCISVSRRDKVFVFCITLKEKTIRIFASKQLDKVVQEKLLFITKMI